MKKYIIAAILSILATGFANAQQTINLLTSEKSVIWGQAYTANSVVRFPSSAQAELPAEVWAAAQRSSGLYVRFKTEATSITVNYTGSNRNANIWYLNTGNVTTGGFDMYQRNGNDWYWVRPSTVTMGSSFVFANITASGKKEYCLYLPTAISLSALSIEVTTGSVEFINVPQEFQPIVFYGATHINGIAVNRPGNTISAITGRNFINVPVVNLGLDTAAKLSVAEIAMLTAIDAQIYVLDVLPNLLSNPETIKDLYVHAVDAIVAERPNAAVILTEHPGFADGYMSPSKNAASDAANTELAAAYSELTTKYPSSKIYYIAKGDLNLDPAVDFANDRFPNEKGTYTYAGEYADKIEDFLTTKTYNVYFVNATDTVSGGSVVYNGTVTTPTNPIPPTPGHYFVGWFYNGVAYDFATPVAHDIYLRAEYTTCSPEKTITYTAEQPARDNLKSDLKALVNGGKIWTTAHRGNTYMGLQAGVPELSLPAIDSAYKYGVEIVELDPQMTSDGEMVLIHDWYEGTALNRTTTGTGHPNEYTLAELKELFLRSGLGGSGSSVTSYKIPTLGEALRHAKDKVYINLDIERYVNVGDGVTIALDLQALIDTVVSCGMIDRTMFYIADNSTIANQMKAINSDVLLFTYAGKTETMDKWIKEPNCVAMQVHQYDDATTANNSGLSLIEHGRIIGMPTFSNFLSTTLDGDITLVECEYDAIDNVIASGLNILQTNYSDLVKEYIHKNPVTPQVWAVNNGTELTDALANAKHGDTLALAAGTYKPSAGGFNITKALVLVGDEDNATILSGDLNNNGIADVGDSPVLSILSPNGKVTLKNIRITNGFTNTNDNTTMAARAGVRVINSVLDMLYCQIDNCKSANTQTGNGAGGAGLYVNGGTVYAYRTVISKNIAHNRGGGIRLQNARPARLTLEGCLLDSNELNNSVSGSATGTADYGGGIQVSGNDNWLYVVNSTITHSVSLRNGAAINSNAPTFIVSSTVSNNTAAAQGGDIRIDGANNTMHIINSIITGPTTPTPSIWLQSAGGQFYSDGYNVFNTWGGTSTYTVTPHSSDNINQSVGDVFGSNVVADNGGYPNTYAPLTAIAGASIDELVAFKEKYGLVQGDVARDQRGYYRSEKTQASRGAHDGEATPTPVYNIGYILNGGDTTGLNMPTTYLVEETPISFTAYTPILEGYTFEGWTPSELTAGTTGDVVITAAWAIDTFDVVFYKNPTEVNEIQRVTYSGSPVAVSQIDSVDYEFSGWYTTPELEQLVSLQAFKVYSDTALYAKWISTSVSTYKVYFKSFEVIVDSQRVEEGQTASAITLSAVPGYVFEGWNFDFTTPIFNDTTLTAQWTKQDTFTVATPIISPTADISYQDSVRVSISCDTADAVIYYSLDGGVTSVLYSEPFKLTTIGKTTVKAVATKANSTYVVYLNSDTAEAEYTITPPPSIVNVVWVTNVGDGNLSSGSPAMSPDNSTVYFSNGVERNLYAINAANGTSKWNFTLGTTVNNAIESSVSVNDQGVIYAPTGTGTGMAQLYAVNPDGTQKWVFDIGDGSRVQNATPVILKSGNVAIGNRGTSGSFRVLSKEDGSLIERHAVESENAVATADNKIYSVGRTAANGVSTFIADNSDFFVNSHQNWTPDGTAYLVGAMAVDTFGNVYGASGNGADGRIFSIKRTEAGVTVKWQFTVDARIENSGVVIGMDGTVYVNGMDNQKIYALDKNGNLKWTFGTDASAQSVPAIDNNGWLHFGDNSGNYYIIKDNETEAELLHKEVLTLDGVTATQINSSPLIDNAGGVYFTVKALDGVYMFKVEVGGVTSHANSAWAMKGGSVQRSGLQNTISKDEPVNVEEPTSELSLIKIYPNPAITEVKISNYVYVPAQYFYIYDIVGKPVMQKIGSEGITTFNVSDLPIGTYIIKYGNQRIKFIKK